MPRRYDKDPYKILGISPTSTAGQVRQAYHRLARQYHPDLNKDPQASERMKDINWANDILSDPQERYSYDAWRNSQYQRTSPPGTTQSPFNTTPPAHRSAPPASSSSQTPYEYVRPTQTSQMPGCSSTMIVWLIITLLINSPRVFRTSLQTTYNYPVEYYSTQTAVVGIFNSAIETLHATQEFSPRYVITPIQTYLAAQHLSPVPTILRDEFGHEDLRPEIIPGTQVWEWINLYFPELTTPDGLSHEVTIVIYDQLS